MPQENVYLEFFPDISFKVPRIFPMNKEMLSNLVTKNIGPNE